MLKRRKKYGIVVVFPNKTHNTLVSGAETMVPAIHNVLLSLEKLLVIRKTD